MFAYNNKSVYYDCMKKKDFGTNALQLMMAFILIVFGIMLETNGTDTVRNISLVLLLVPGLAMLAGFVMNFFTYPYYWSFPVILFGLCALGDIIVYLTAPFKLNTISLVTMIVVDGLTALMGTLFHLLHADIKK